MKDDLVMAAVILLLLLGTGCAPKRQATAVPEVSLATGEHWNEIADSTPKLNPGTKASTPKPIEAAKPSSARETPNSQYPLPPMLSATSEAPPLRIAQEPPRNPFPQDPNDPANAAMSGGTLQTPR